MSRVLRSYLPWAHVRCLYVPVDDSFRMCGIKGIGSSHAQTEHRLDFQRLASDPVPERVALQQFHGDEGSPIGLVNLMDRGNVRVVQGGRCLGLPLQTAGGLPVVGGFVGKALASDEAVGKLPTARTGRCPMVERAAKLDTIFAPPPTVQAAETLFVDIQGKLRKAACKESRE